MDLVGKQVMHRVFGKGCVTSLDSGRIVVRFSEGAGEKAFCYPDAFAQHLTLEAAEDREQILSLLQQRRRQRTEHYIRQGQIDGGKASNPTKERRGQGGRSGAGIDRRGGRVRSDLIAARKSRLCGPPRPAAGMAGMSRTAHRP